MKPYTRSIIELFDGKRRYLIPLYQRQYAWRVQPQLELLWEDIEHAVNRLTTNRASLSPHFMGALVLTQLKTFGKQVQAFEIIDGQQRLTTFQLLLAALRDIATHNGSRYAEELQKYLVNDGVMENPDIERYKLWPSLADRRALVSIIDSSIDLNTIAPVPNDENGYVRRAVLAYDFFKQKIASHVLLGGVYDELRLENLFEALKEGLAVVSIELETGDDPQTIFETLNSRGVDLAPADLMRNFIFQRAKGLGQLGGTLLVDNLYEKHWQPLDRTFWNQSASRGRQTRQRLDWMLTDHLSMQLGNLISVESLFESYRRWILSNQPFDSVNDELESISSTAAVEMKLFEQDKNDALGVFGRFADAFDVSTAMPLVIYLATELGPGKDLSLGLEVLQSYILRRDICGLTTKNYNRLFVGLIPRLRAAEGNKINEMIDYLSSRHSDIDRWPDNSEWMESWIGRSQYKSARQPRLRYIFEAIETAKRTSMNENIEIKSQLSIEHIMPQTWKNNWPIPNFDVSNDESDLEYILKTVERDEAVNKLGNLTLLTGPLNSSISNGPYSVKMPAIRAQSGLALNRDLNTYNDWNEELIVKRGHDLFKYACQIWMEPERKDGFKILNQNNNTDSELNAKMPSEGICRFTYYDKTYEGKVVDGILYVEGISGGFKSLSAASVAITNTSRNGWNDWYFLDTKGGWILANQMRQLR